MARSKNVVTIVADPEEAINKVNREGIIMSTKHKGLPRFLQNTLVPVMFIGPAKDGNDAHQICREWQDAKRRGVANKVETGVELAQKWGLSVLVNGNIMGVPFMDQNVPKELYHE